EPRPEGKQGYEKQEAQKRLLASAALAAWPRGETAERLRLETLHKKRDAELARAELSRNYGKLIKAYDEQIAEVRKLTPQSAFVATLEGERKALRTDADNLLPKAQQVFQSGVYQTEFLEAFLANYPQVPEVTKAEFDLAGAYSRTGRDADAVERYLA